MGKKVLITLGVKPARQTAKSLEFIRRNLERIYGYLPSDRHAMDIYKQLIYDSSIVYANMHDELEMAAFSNGGAVKVH